MTLKKDKKELILKYHCKCLYFYFFDNSLSKTKKLFYWASYIL